MTIISSKLLKIPVSLNTIGIPVGPKIDNSHRMLVVKQILVHFFETGEAFKIGKSSYDPVKHEIE